MWCDLSQKQQEHFPLDSNFTIRLATTEDYLVSDEEDDMLFQALSNETPCRVFHVVAVRGTVRLGSCLLNVTAGELGIGTLFHMMVAPKERKQGIGASLVQAVCEMARKMGLNHLTLNATELGERLYRRFGFQTMGWKPSWFLKSDILAEPCPTTQQVKFLEAVGLGDVEVLAKMRKSLTHNQFQDATLNDLTPFEIAAKCQQPVSASWLLDQGVIPDIISVWDLGWKDRVPGLLAKHPDLVQRGSWTATPLHIAIERNDIDLAQLLLTVPNDLNAKDANLRLTPVELARHFQRKQILSLLETQPDFVDPNDLRAVLESILGKEQIRKDLVVVGAKHD